MKIKILAFGQIAEIIGKTEISISDVKHTTQLNQKLKETFPLLTTAKYVLAVNQIGRAHV